MALDNSAKIGDIITALEGMQAINQKAELASVIGSPATATDNIATQITKIQDAKDVFAEKIGVENTTPLQQMAESMVVGKKWASGTKTTTAYTNLSYGTLSTGNGYACAGITVTGLSFKPSLIVAINREGHNNMIIYLPYTATSTAASYKGNIILIESLLGNSSVKAIMEGGSVSVTNTSFSLPTIESGSGVGNTFTYEWLAFE